MAKIRLDQALVKQKLVETRSQAENYIKLGVVKLDGRAITKPGFIVNSDAKLEISGGQYVSRAGLKLASVAKDLKVDFTNKVVLDVGSSTGGFTDYALQNAAQKVIAVDVGSNQLHPKLRTNKRVELHEQTDIRNIEKLSTVPQIILIDVSFISLRQILPHIAKLANNKTEILAMVKPQFEASKTEVNKGVIKNDRIRREILKNFELWARRYFRIEAKADSKIPGSKGNLERFYLLRIV